MTYRVKYAGMQGSAIRTEPLGYLRLTESSYRPGLRIESHSHRSAVFGLILDGLLEQTSSKVNMCCPAGSVFYNPPDIPHTNRIDKTGARCVNLEVSPEWFNRADLDEPLVGDPLVCPGPRIQLLAKRIYAEWLGKDNLTSLMIEGLTCELVSELIRGKTLPAERRAPAWLERVRDQLRSTYVDPPSLHELSSEAGVHQVHVARQFRKYYGMSIGEFVRQTRVEVARMKLCDGKLSMVEIALETGFAHQAHFITVFKKVMAMTPRQYFIAVRGSHRN
jgi:AraC family transcriptional regulator